MQPVKLSDCGLTSRTVAESKQKLEGQIKMLRLLGKAENLNIPYAPL